MGLAGQKKKQVISADPQNLHWKNDTSSFGFKMLQKMGWTQGKGLGANEDGDAEHIKIKLKENSFGLGADQRTVDNWLGNTSAFSELLKSLNNEEDQALVSVEDTIFVNPLKEKSHKKKVKKDKSSDKSLKKIEKSSKKEKKEKSSKKEKLSKKENEQTENIVMRGRLHHRAKFVMNKKIAFQDPEALRGILGI